MVFSSNTGFNEQAASSIREIQEIALTITTKNLNPAMLSEDFLKFSGIIPNDWELGKQPVLSPNFSQVVFQNGVSVVAQPRTLIILETVDPQSDRDPKVPQVARQYVEKLPHAEYQAFSTGIKNIVPISGSQDAARRYVTGILLAPGPWQDFGKAPVQAGVNFLYLLEDCQLSVNVNEARLQVADRAAVPALIFAGSFNYNIASDSEIERLGKLTHAIDNWRSNWETFKELVHQRFLTQANRGFLAQMEQESLFSPDNS